MKIGMGPPMIVPLVAGPESMWASGDGVEQTVITIQYYLCLFPVRFSPNSEARGKLVGECPCRKLLSRHLIYDKSVQVFVEWLAVAAFLLRTHAGVGARLGRVLRYAGAGLDR